MPERPLAIAVEGLQKDFRLASEQRHTLKERVVNPRFDRSAKVFHALRDVSFDVKRGEFFGIVGRNGSGKSTLLKCMAGIYKLDAGSIKIGGRLSTFIELGVGFNPDLAARDNIILNGIMLGLSPKEAARRVEPVISFAGLEEHVDLKLKNYSSGMQVRLAFSVLTQVDADVLLIDEVLAVGDAAFQAKCFEVFRQLREAGKTIILVTHDMSAVTRFCDRAMLLEDGNIIDIGNPESIGDQYMTLNFERNEASAQDGASDSAPVETGAVSAGRALLINRDDEVVQHVRSGDVAQIALDVFAHQDISAPLVTVELRDDFDNVIFAASTESVVHESDDVLHLGAGTVWRFTVWFQALLAPGKLRVQAILHDRASGKLLERTGDLLHFDITSSRQIPGMTNLPQHLTWNRLENVEQLPVPPLDPVGVERSPA